MSADLLRIQPDQVIFKDLEDGEEDSIEVCVTNISRKTLKLRFVIDDPHFRLSPGPDFNVSPGLTIRKSVMYTGDSSQIRKSSILIQNTERDYKIPIIAYPPTPSFSVNTTLIDLGNITVASSQKHTFSLSNFGTKDGTYKLISSNEHAILTPQNGVVYANRSEEIGVSFKPPNPGKYEFDITIEVDSSLTELPKIHVIGNVIDQSIILIDKEKEVDIIDYGHSFYGQKVEKMITFRNKSPMRHTFSLNFAAHQGKSTELYFLQDKDEYVIEGHSDLAIPVYFYPPLKNYQDNLEDRFEQIFVLSIKNTSYTKEITFKARASHLIINLRKTDFQFGQQKVKTSSSQILEVENRSTYAVPYKFIETAQFGFKPLSGTLKSNSTTTLEIIFSPNNLGKFVSSTKLIICNGFLKRRINLIGESISTDSEMKFKRRPVWETDRAARKNAEFPNNPFCMTMRDLKAQTLRNEEFHSYITESAEERQEKAMRKELIKKAQETARNELTLTRKGFTQNMLDDLSLEKLKELEYKRDHIDLGMAPAEGLEPPSPRVPSGRAPMYVPPSIANKKLSVTFGKDSKKQKHHSQPKTKLEIAECSKTLNAQQQLSIVPSAEEINFGTVCVFSTETKPFTITNNLNQHIFVVFAPIENEFSMTNPMSQVIPPQQSAQFNIVFRCDSQNRVAAPLKYTINGQHEFSIMCIAKTIPLNVTLSQEELSFKFTQNIEEGIQTQTIEVENPTSAKAQYQWNGLKGPFTIKPPRGVIPPKEKQVFEVTYKPATESKNEVVCKLEVVGGPSHLMKLTGEAGSPQLSLSKNVADFGLFNLNTERVIDILLTNSSDDVGLFNIAPNFTDVLNIYPPSGKINGRETVSITICANASKPGKFEIPVQVNICGQPPLPLTVCGDAEIPHVDLEFENLNFGSIFLGDYEKRTIKVSNPSENPVYFSFDITEFENFKIEWDEKALIKSGNSIRLEKEIFPSDYEEDQLPERNYEMAILPQTTLEFDFVFKPVKHGKSNFDLPFYLDEDLDMVCNESIRVFAEALKPPITVSDHWIDFGIATQTDALNPNIRPTVRQIVLTNEVNGDIKYHFDTSHIDPAFSVEPADGVIKYSTVTNVFIKLRPTSGYLIDCFMPLIATTEDSEFLCAKIEITAIVNSRPIKPSQQNVILPPVPLGTKIEKTIYIENTMAIESDLDAVIPVNEKAFPIVVNFPEGRSLQHTTEKLPINISFMSPKPLSFSTQIAIVDTAGNSCTFTVSAITDNSVFTLHNLIHTDNYNVSAGRGGPILANFRSNASENDILQRFLTVDDVKDAKEIKGTISHCSTRFLTSFLNTFVLKTKIKQFPYDFAESYGELIVEMISNLMGSKKPQNLSNISKLRTDTDENKIAKLKAILTFLLSQGAHLSNIRPELLLPKDDFVRAYTQKIINNLLANDSAKKADVKGKKLNSFINTEQFKDKLQPRIRVLDELYDHLIIEAWMQVVFQVLKLFYMTKADVEHFNQIGGVADTIKQLHSMLEDNVMVEVDRSMKSCCSSNFMTAVECVILKWVSIYFTYAQKKASVITDFNKLRNPLIYAAIIKAHVKNVEIPLIEIPKTQHDLDENCKNVSKAINNLQTGLSVTPDFLNHGCPTMHALFAYQLMESLPHYIPTQSVEFVAELNTKVTQNISISNPSQSEITYCASISGSSGFTLVNETVTVKPNGHADCVVACFARSHHPETAVLSLTPKKHNVMPPRPPSGIGGRRASYARLSFRSFSQLPTIIDNEPPSTPAAIIINMSSRVNIGMPKEEVQCKGIIYETNQCTLNIKNMFGKAATYKMYHRSTLLMDERCNIMVTPTGDINMIQRLIEYPDAPPEPSKVGTRMDQLIANHDPFIFNSHEVEFTNEGAQIPIEFVPVCVGVYRCILLFVNDDIGEFLIEVTGKTMMNDIIDSTTHCKAECMKEMEVSVNIDAVNKPLAHAVAYAIMKHAALENCLTETKQREMLVAQTREVYNAYAAIFPSICYSGTSSLPEFTVEDEIYMSKKQDGQPASITVKFAPKKPGVYTGKIILMNRFDLRILKVIGTGYAQTKYLTVEMKTTVGKKISQDLPFENPSKNVWNYKVMLESSSSFSCKNKLIVKPKSIAMFPVHFCSNSLGKFRARLTVTNLTKGSTVVYDFIIEVQEPLAEDKIKLTTRAREKVTHNIDLPPFIEKGLVKIESDVPILSFRKNIEYNHWKPDNQFSFSAISPVSGICVGTIKFTDISTGLYCWYVIEITVTRPLPSGVFPITTIQRQPVDIKIPMSNTRKQPIKFSVELSDRDLHGEKELACPPSSESSYIVHFLPFTSYEKELTVTFFNQDEGEFIFILQVSVTTPGPVTMAPVSSFVGSYARVYVLIENKDQQDATMTVSNDNPDAFLVMAKQSFVVNAGKSKSVEIRYMPSTIGVTERALVQFSSAEIGEYSFALSGFGKPPQPQSPLLIESSIGTTNSGCVIFYHPFQRPTTFELSIFSEDLGVFSFLQKRRSFTLFQYNDQQQISFSYTAKKLGQSNGTVIVSCNQDQKNPIAWKFPIIGITNTGIGRTTQDLSGKSGAMVQKEMIFHVAGERESFKISDYKVDLEFRNGFDWLSKYVEVRPISISGQAEDYNIKLLVRATMRKPIATQITVLITNPLDQSWRFPVNLNIGRGDACKTITIESMISSSKSERVYVPEKFPARTDFKAYFLQGSAAEFSLSAHSGVIEGSIMDEVEIPLDVTFAPKTYGKLMKATLVIETDEVMCLVEVIGKMPEYVPPVIKSGRINCTIPKQEKNKSLRKSRRNIIKENIESARITKPKSARRQRRSVFE